MAASLAVTPETAAYRLLCSVLLGCALGIFYDFLQAPGQKHRHLADLVFSLGTLWVWLYLSFAVCLGDIRLVCLLGLLTGLLVWEASAGKWLQPLFALFWTGIARLWDFVLFPWKKILYFSKILFASAEKWVTIECTKIKESRKKRRKESHGRKKHPAQNSESTNPSCIQYP